MRASDWGATARYDGRSDSLVAAHHALDTTLTSGRLLTRTAPCWVDRLYFALVVYTIACAVFMLSGIGGEQVTHYIGLFSDAPADLIACIVAFTAARRTRHGPSRQAWTWLAIALALYLTGTLITIYSWLHGIDPFPGVSDVFFSAFYPAMLVAALLLVRAAAIRVPWIQLCLDATIFILGFGTFFWFLVIHPGAGNSDVDTLKQGLSEAYASLDCLVLLVLGVPLLAGVEGRRIPLLLMAGFAAMFLADVFWSLAKLRGYYASGEVQDVFYVMCHLPWAAAAREQMRTPMRPRRMESNKADSLARALPYAALFTALFVLVYLTRGDIGGSAALMTTVVFALTLLLMIRQGVVLRGDAVVREKRAARLVEDRFASLIANASDVIMIVESDGTLRFVSAACERTLGFKPDDLMGKNLLDVWSGPDRERLRELLKEIAATPYGTVGPVELVIERGSDRYVLEGVGSNLTADPAVSGLALNLRDISERKALEQQLRQMAFHDPLTLLANRTLFKDRVQHALVAARDSAPVAVLFLDLDNFKTINDSLGHDAGDRLLQAVAHRIAKSTRASDTVARLGGDEFAILLERIAQPGDAQRVAESLIETLGVPFVLSGMEARVSASIGLAFNASAGGAESLLANADIAMYHAKAAGKNRYAIFEPQMQDVLHERLRLEADIGRAILEHEFFLEYQPIVDLGTRSLLGVEALVRWRHPQAGVLMPMQFIPVAEECGQIVKLGRWVLAQACCALVSWRDCVAGGNGLRVSVNISGRHLQHGDLVGDVADALAISGLEPANLVIELTESTIMYNTDANLERLQNLKALGVRLALDDFGTGYSSLSYLHRFPIDILKIDRSFVSRLTISENGPELARAVITLGENLGLDIVAEGIELEQQVTSLLELRCVAGQGFLFAKAAALEELSGSAFVARRNEHWTAAAADEIQSASGRFAALKAASL
jgi:diguanylate cyclase (GGDEF)-like protein/PAS domain S-box-containing protein